MGVSTHLKSQQLPTRGQLPTVYSLPQKGVPWSSLGDTRPCQAVCSGPSTRPHTTPLASESGAPGWFPGDRSQARAHQLGPGRCDLVTYITCTGSQADGGGVSTAGPGERAHPSRQVLTSSLYRLLIRMESDDDETEAPCPARGHRAERRRPHSNPGLLGLVLFSPHQAAWLLVPHSRPHCLPRGQRLQPGVRQGLSFTGLEFQERGSGPAAAVGPRALHEGQSPAELTEACGSGALCEASFPP